MSGDVGVEISGPFVVEYDLNTIELRIYIILFSVLSYDLVVGQRTVILDTLID